MKTFAKLTRLARFGKSFHFARRAPNRTAAVRLGYRHGLVTL
jgi:hypothetical protein